ncbi:hypothetical protein N7472_002765 [Penicillium cf. griseofulvum]|uniref:Mid2 domain-containing protein n=1 Tax=Penicillium cf. griseofulvum TaxID=2972120 RepID=A0A9W9MS47_9EURO|nr:hypothetical protein N7472_002765 [Penicillium cf. griseofulvum]
MKPSPLLSFLLYFVCLPSVSAWIFTWHEPDGKLQAFHADVEKDCEQMDNPVGHVFDWSPQAGHWCIFLYENTRCEEPSAGNTCKTYAWTNHPSSKHLLSFKVMNNTAGFEPSTLASSSTTTTDAKPSPTSKVTTTTTDATHAASSSPSASSIADGQPTVSGGAIAGIVVGVLAAVAIAGILIFFLIRRRRRNAVQPGVARGNATFGMAELSSPIDEKSAPNIPGYQAELASPNEEKSSAFDRPRHHAQGYRELHGSAVASEIGGGRAT